MENLNLYTSERYNVEIEEIVEKKYNTKEREETILRAFDNFFSKL